MDPAERIQAASKFLLQSPPGEINDVLNDVRIIIADDESLQDGVLPALREYNLSQFITVDIPGKDYQAIVSEAARVVDEEEERFLDPRSGITFSFDHLRLEASDSQQAEINQEAEPLRVALQSATLTYLSAHFHEGVGSVFSSPGSPRVYTLQIVGNKYNPSNYWSGRWRSEYSIDLNSSQVTGRISVQVHYYEQGNVQLSSEHKISLRLPPAVASAKDAGASNKILALIGEEETKYQTSINTTYHEMREKTFKGLRRALPLTRQKIDWDKVTGYRLGAELSSNKGVFGGSSS